MSSTEYRTGDLTIAKRAPYLLLYIRHYNKRLEIYVIYKAAYTSSLIRTYRRTDMGRDIVASAMKQIATKTVEKPVFTGFLFCYWILQFRIPLGSSFNGEKLTRGWISCTKHFCRISSSFQFLQAIRSVRTNYGRSL